MNADETPGLYKTQLGTIDNAQPLLVSPGGTQRLASTITEQTEYDDTTVTLLENVGGVWMDNGVPLNAQPPTLGSVIKISRTGDLEGADLTRLLLAGTDADFEAGGFLLKAWVLPVGPYTPYLKIGVSNPVRTGTVELYKPTANQDWFPILLWDSHDPNGDGTDYVATSRLISSYQDYSLHTEFYIAYDLLLNEADVNGTVAPGTDFDGDNYVGLSDLDRLLADWGRDTLPEPVTGDVDGDGFVGLSDLDILLHNWNESVDPEALNTGDLTGDGFVGLADLDYLLLNWNQGTLPEDPLQTDVNKDGVVGLGDLDTLLAEWGTFSPTTGMVPGYSILPSDQTDLAGGAGKNLRGRCPHQQTVSSLLPWR